MFSHLHKSTILVLCCFAYVIGTGIATTTPLPTVAIGVIFVVAAFFGSLLRSPQMRVLLFILMALCIASGRALFLPDYADNPYDQYVNISAEIVREPDLALDKQRVTVNSRTINGLLQLTLALQPRLQVGDQLTVACNLRKPEPSDEFRYDQYLARHGISSTCSFPKIEKVGEHQSFMRTLFVFKQKSVYALEQIMPFPENTLLLGILFGEQHSVHPALLQQFQLTGTTHLLVISGMQIVLIAQVLISMMKYLPIPKRWAIILVMLALGLYGVFTGVQASAMRAVFCSSTLLFAELFGRRGQALRIILFVATAMLFVNPLLLIYDVGFQLSFAATVGIILFTRPLEKIFTRIPELLGLRTCVATTLAASSTTAPIIAYNFHTFSAISLIANVILVPIMTVITLAGAVIAILALCLPTMTVWLALPLYFLVHLFIQLMQALARVPHASLPIPTFHPFLLLVSFVVIAFFAVRVNRKKTI